MSYSEWANDQLRDFWRTQTEQDESGHVPSGAMADAFRQYRAELGQGGAAWTSSRFVRTSMREVDLAAAGAEYRVGRPPGGKPLRAWWGVRLVNR